MVLKDVPKKTVEFGSTGFHSIPLNFGIEHIDTESTVYDLSTVLPETTMTQVQWTKLLKAIIYVMLDDSIED
eukprot:4616832-Karenia_brevis.AAC.1